eukprot:INCI16569.1.p1 GENE.INCI16569.1~~INCI16569.1.p1  ORF type:complete len:398 (-),score=91.75 INCI16569.1:254-1447(-)
MGTFQSRLHFERWTLDQVAELKLRWIGAFGMAPQLTADELLSLLSGGGYPPTPQKVDELTVAHIFEAFKLRQLVASEESGDESERTGSVAADPSPKSGQHPPLSTPELGHVPAGSATSATPIAKKITDFPTPETSAAGGGGTNPVLDSENNNSNGGVSNLEPDIQAESGVNDNIATQDLVAVEREKQEEPDEMNALAFFAALQVCCRGLAREKLSSLYDFFDFNLSGMMDRDELLLLVVATWSGLLQTVGLFERESFPIDTMQAACERVADKVMEQSLAFATNGFQSKTNPISSDDGVDLDETVQVSDVDKKRAVVSKRVFEKVVEGQLTRQSTKTSSTDSPSDEEGLEAVTGAAAAISSDMLPKEAACIARYYDTLFDFCRLHEKKSARVDQMIIE